MKESRLTAWVIITLSLTTIILAITVLVLIKYQMPKGASPIPTSLPSGREVIPENLPPLPTPNQGGQEGSGSPDIPMPGR